VHRFLCLYFMFRHYHLAETDTRALEEIAVALLREPERLGL